jgi:hypothetical protein
VTRLRDLWAGRLPLHEVVWTWGVFRGTLLNLGCTAASLLIWLVQGTGPIATGALFIHFLPVPYNLIFAVGAWRSAADPHYSQRTRVLARVFAIALAALFMVI